MAMTELARLIQPPAPRPPGEPPATEPEIVGILETDNFSDVDQFDRAIGRFGAGELGQIDIPLDPVVAIDEYYPDILQSVYSLDQAMFDEGLLPWPGFSSIAELIWEDRKVRILFRTPGGPSPAPAPAPVNDTDPDIYGERIADVPARHAGVKDVLEEAVSVADTDSWHVSQHSSPFHSPYQTPSVWGFALFRGFLGRTGGLLKRDAAMRQFAAQGGRPIVVTTADAAALRAARLAARESVLAQRGVGRLPPLKFLIPGGLLVFFLVEHYTGIPVLSWPADKAKEYVIGPALEGAKAAAKDALDEVAKEIEEVTGDYGLYIIGGIAVVAGLWLATR